MKTSVMLAAVVVIFPALGWAELRFQPFDQDPPWDGHNNFSEDFERRPILQDFGYSATTNCDATPGEIGGAITPDGVPAYYAKQLSTLTFDDTFKVSGTLKVDGGGNTLFGFFNPATANEWRMANSVVFRIYGRGSGFHVYFEYGTSLWRVSAGGFQYFDQVEQTYVPEFPYDDVYEWSLTYRPVGADGGEVEASFGGQSSTCTLYPGHRADGGVFTHFGLLNVIKHADDTGHLWLDNIVINGVPQGLTEDPGWDESGNHASYLSEDTRPRFAFGYSATQYNGGPVGEIGGKLYRGDCRYPESMAYYADTIADLSLDSPLEASGKVCLRRAVSDSTVLFGFFHSEDSVEVNLAQDQGLPKDFLGLAIEGPSVEGFYIYPCYRTNADYGGRGQVVGLPRIYPDSNVREWALVYDPEANSGAGEIRLTCGGVTGVLPLAPGHKEQGARFNRFGFITTWIDGNGQTVYFDDLTYTVDVPTTAAFSATPRSGPAPLEVAFTDESVSKYAITGWIWDFGDGSPHSNERHPLHTYAENGAYAVTLTVQTAQDADTLARNWYIDVGNMLPGPGAAALAALGLLIAAGAARYLRRK